MARFAPVACAGPLLEGELAALERALEKPARPLVAIVAGSKVSTKLTILEALLEKVDRLIVGGGIANTFLAATFATGTTSASADAANSVATTTSVGTGISTPSSRDRASRLAAIGTMSAS